MISSKVTSFAASREDRTTISVLPAPRRSITGPCNRARSLRAWCATLEVARWWKLPIKGRLQGPGGRLGLECVACFWRNRGESKSSRRRQVIRKQRRESASSSIFALLFCVGDEYKNYHKLACNLRVRKTSIYIFPTSSSSAGFSNLLIIFIKSW